MISPERLRRYPHCAGAPDEMLKSVAMLARERPFKAGERLVEEGATATKLMLLDAGEVDIVYRLGDDRDVTVDTLVEGDLMAWSALLEPHRLTATGIARKDGLVIEIEAEGLRGICQANPTYGYQMMTQVAIALRDRLSATRVQLAALG
ncbi:MAG TPA: cyclic nucleotide-binding domain-containing protein [Anaerolineales bacterium]|jgi:CRP-like cAMP-binding protein|nr:cyclic nucleotide-binding domain-containing protein [Anaerolineales bacterium]